MEADIRSFERAALSLLPLDNNALTCSLSLVPVSAEQKQLDSRTQNIVEGCQQKKLQPKSAPVYGLDGSNAPNVSRNTTQQAVDTANASQDQNTAGSLQRLSRWQRFKPQNSAAPTTFQAQSLSQGQEAAAWLQPNSQILQSQSENLACNKASQEDGELAICTAAATAVPPQGNEPNLVLASSPARLPDLQARNSSPSMPSESRKGLWPPTSSAGRNTSGLQIDLDLGTASSCQQGAPPAQHWLARTSVGAGRSSATQAGNSPQPALRIELDTEGASAAKDVGGTRKQQPRHAEITAGGQLNTGVQTNLKSLQRRQWSLPFAAPRPVLKAAASNESSPLGAPVLQRNTGSQDVGNEQLNACSSTPLTASQTLVLSGCGRRELPFIVRHVEPATSEDLRYTLEPYNQTMKYSREHAAEKRSRQQAKMPKQAADTATALTSKLAPASQVEPDQEQAASRVEPNQNWAASHEVLNKAATPELREQAPEQHEQPGRQNIHSSVAIETPGGEASTIDTPLMASAVMPISSGVKSTTGRKRFSTKNKPKRPLKKAYAEDVDLDLEASRHADLQSFLDLEKAETAEQTAEMSSAARQFKRLRRADGSSTPCEEPASEQPSPQRKLSAAGGTISSLALCAASELQDLETDLQQDRNAQATRKQNEELPDHTSSTSWDTQGAKNPFLSERSKEKNNKAALARDIRRRRPHSKEPELPSQHMTSLLQSFPRSSYQAGKHAAAGTTDAPIDLTEDEPLPSAGEHRAAQHAGANQQWRNESQWQDNQHVQRPHKELAGASGKVEETENASQKPWWYRLPDFVPLAALAEGVNPRTGAVVYIDYKSQFQDEIRHASSDRSAAAVPKCKAPTKRQAKPRKGGAAKKPAARKTFWAKKKYFRG